MRNRIAAARLAAIAGLAAGLAATSPAALAQSKSNDPVFGNRTDKPDGSSTLTVGRRLQAEWDTKFGLDAKLAPELASPSLSDSMMQTPTTSRSSGAVWGTVTGPSVAPLLFDTTSVDARFDGGEEKGQIAATLSRTVPLGKDVSITVRDKYSVAQTMQSHVAGQTAPTSVFESDRSLRLNLAPTSTTLSAGVIMSNVDNQWHNRLSAEQKIVGPLNVTTSITDPGSAASSKRISAGFKHTW